MLLERKRGPKQRGFALIAGPCVIESEALAMEVAEHLHLITTRLGIPFIFKASFDKANRSSVHAFRGLGREAGLRVLADIKSRFAIPVLTDVHESYQVGPVSEVVDMLQIPAYLCRQTDLIQACVSSGRAVNIKKGQFLSPREMCLVVEKARFFAEEATSLAVCERGASFGYNNLVVDMRSLVTLRETKEWVVFDATHSVQRPGLTATGSGGERCFVRPLARAALAVGVDALFMETHPDPERALSDGPNSMLLSEMEILLEQCQAIDQLTLQHDGVR